MAGLRFADVSFSYGPAPVLKRVSVELGTGELAALLGPNGAGKSTFLRLASGTPHPTHGRVSLDGEALRLIPRRLRARRIAMVPQALEVPFNFTVRELVALGRTPHIQPFLGLRPRDEQAVSEALELTGTAPLADRSVFELSAGERQRVLLAMALAQEPELLLLDEPTAHLDISYQMAMLELVRELNRTRGLTVLAAIHDLNLAAMCFGRLLVLHEGQIVASGPPRAVLTSALIERVYGSPALVIDHPSEPVPLVVLQRNNHMR